MKTQTLNRDPWNKIAALAARATPDSGDVPPGFATRVVANWMRRPSERAWAALEFLTWRGLAVAAIILCGCAAVSYDTLSGLFMGETPLLGGWVDSLLTP